MKNVLVIEDNENNMKLITFILEKNGYSTVGAENGRDGISLAQKEKLDFIILDIQLPDMNGLEVIKEIRKLNINGEIPIIAVTSYAMGGDKEKFMAAGCNGYIEKPIDPATVIEQIKKIIGDKP